MDCVSGSPRHKDYHYGKVIQDLFALPMAIHPVPSVQLAWITTS